ncbi:flavin reductase family protein [Dactylosporangium sp. CS-033363]|uniref:flavin reductase family protein n=1 Tax=Dactylosporangium sp. CS-033363 TaxID=3239935 RepID=UPI003D90CD4B
MTATTGGGLSGDAFREAMAEVCGPVTVVTAMEDGRPHGTTVSAFTSLSLDPPLVTVALDRRSDLLAMVTRTGSLAVNVLGAHQEAVARRFARKGDDKFDGIAWEPHHGLPLLPGTVVWLGCTVLPFMDGGDHVIVVARVDRVRTMPGRPLLYHRRQFGTHVTLRGDMVTSTPAP